MQAQFTAVIWRSLRNAPPLTELLRQWLHVLSPQLGQAPPQAVDAQLALLMRNCGPTLYGGHFPVSPERAARWYSVIEPVRHAA